MMKKLLLFLAFLMPTMAWASNTTIAEKCWELGAWLISNEDVGATAKMTSDGLAITNPDVQENAWTPQAIVLDGFSLKKGHDYTVRLNVKIPASGKLQVNMGSWEYSDQHDISVKKKTAFQEIDINFPKWGESINGDAHVLFQNGLIKGTTVLQTIKVLDVTKGDTTLVAEHGYWFGDEDTGSTCKVTNDGLSIKNPKVQTEYWTPQTLVLRYFKLQKNHTYKVIFDAKVPSSGYLQAQLGTWGGGDCWDNPIWVEGSNEFQEYEFYFENFSSDAEDGHVLFQNGNIKGTCVLRNVRVVEIGGNVKLNKTKATIEKGKTLTLKATSVTPDYLGDKTVTWKSSNTKVAKVSSSGKVTAVGAGTATITCTSVATSAKATCKVTVGYVDLDKSEAVVEKGKTMTLTPTVYPSSLEDKSVTWTSSDTKIATVTSKGKVKGVKAGTATITCTSNATGLKTTCKVTVGYVKLDQTETIIEKGKTKTLKATVYPSALKDKSVTWQSSNTAVATVTSAGKVKGVKAGKAVITCTSNATGLKTTCIVTVGYVKLDQTEISVVKGKTMTLTATVYPSSLEDKSVTWESSNTAVATVTSAGKVKGIKAGSAVITCTSNATGLSTVCIVTVTKSSTSRSLDGDDDTTGIEDEVINDPAAMEPFDVYDLSGHKLLDQVTSLDGLPNGIYIVNGKKVLKK